MAASREPSSAPASAATHCARCGAAFHCGIDDAGGCWCSRLPPLPGEAYAAGTGCLCEACLSKALKGEPGQGGRKLDGVLGIKRPLMSWRQPVPPQRGSSRPKRVNPQPPKARQPHR